MSVITRLGANIVSAGQGGQQLSFNKYGNIIALGAPQYPNSSFPNLTGQLKIYTYNNNNWSQLGGNIDGDAQSCLGYSPSLSSDGYTVAVGLPTYVILNGTQGSGNVKIYSYTNSTWSQKGSTIVCGTVNDGTGISVSLNNFGNIVACGSPFFSSNRGLVRVYYFNNGWIQLGGNIIGNASDKLGFSVSLSNNGYTVASSCFNNNCVKLYNYNSNTNNWDLNQTFVTSGSTTKRCTYVKLSDDGNSIIYNEITPVNAQYYYLSNVIYSYKYYNNTWNKINFNTSIVPNGNSSINSLGLGISLSNDGSKLSYAYHNTSNNNSYLNVLTYDNINNTWNNYSPTPYELTFNGLNIITTTNDLYNSAFNTLVYNNRLVVSSSFVQNVNFTATGTYTSTIIGSYTVVTFTSGSGTISIRGVNSVNVLVVAGGGGGGVNLGSGGGGGGVINSSSYAITSGSPISLSVGAGGSSALTGGDQGTNGANSIFGTLTAIGGGAGCGQSAAYNNGKFPQSGGSGGGQTRNSTIIGQGTAGQGNAGGTYTDLACGGGGGATSSGGNGNPISANSYRGGSGGAGYFYPITGLHYGGGGGGSSQGTISAFGTSSQAPGGTGGGGASSNFSSSTVTIAAVSGTNGLGGGGGGSNTFPGTTGGNGVVIVAFLTSNVGITQVYLNNSAPILTIPNYTKTYNDASFSILPDISTTNDDEPGPTYSYSSNFPLVANIVAGNMIIGNAGTANIRITQSATTNYTAVTANTTITVNKSTSTLTFPSGFTRNFRDASFSIIPNIITNNPEGPPFIYSYSSNFPLVANIVAGNMIIGNAGTANITINQSATTNYSSVTANTTITVNKLQANLGYPFSSYTKNYKDLSFNVNANTTNTDSGQILYSTDNFIVANINTTGNVTIGNAGTANITLTRNATTNYNSVSANILITVNKLQANLVYPFSSYTKNYKDLSFNVNANTTNTDSGQILYFTDNSIVANINTTGNVTIGNAGTANITLTRSETTNYNSVTANIVINVNKIQAILGYPFSSYTKNYLDASFNVNANTTNTDNTEILYFTDNSNVVTVNTTGNVTIGNVGTANITLFGNATTNYNSVSANIVITVNKIQATLGYPFSSYTKNYLDASFNVNANTTNTDSTEILYSTNNSTVATVDINGNVTIGNAGTANITLFGNATANYNSVSANIVINVNKIQANLGYPFSSYTKNYLDASFNLNANTTNTDNTQISYSTNNSTVATVDTTGNVIIGNAGTANITLTQSATTNYNSVSANIVINVNKIQANLGYPFSSYTKNYLDASFNVNANTTNTDSGQILYFTDNSIVANINTTGNVTIGNAGTANITLTRNATTNYNSVTANIVINVNKIQANLGYPFSNYTKNYLDASFNVNANTTNTDSTQILYFTDNTNVATVNTTGNVTIGNAGTANITLFGNATTNYNSINANILINVNKIQANLGYPFSSYTKNYKDLSFNVNANTTNTDNTTILYYTDNPIVANVNTAGNVTIGNLGMANITLTQSETTNYFSTTANIIITVKEATPTLTIPNFTKYYRDLSFSILPNITTNNSDIPAPTYTYQSDYPYIANAVNGIVTIGNIGKANITITQSETSNYTSITANTTITVSPPLGNLTFAYTTSTALSRRGVVYGNGLFVSVGAGNTIMTSSDGRNWSNNTIAISNTYVFWRIVYAEVQITNKKLFVAVSSNSNIIINSENGTNWNTIQLDSTISTGIFTGITYGQVTSTGESIFIAVGTTDFIKSTDGNTWTKIVHPNISVGGLDITYGVTTNNNQGMFVAVLRSTTNIAYSRDAINWSTTDVAGSHYWVGYGIVKSTNTSLFITGHNSSNSSYNISSDGIHWTNFSLPYPSIAMGYGNGIFTIASNQNSFFYTLDGLDWYIYNITGSWNNITYGQGNFVAVNPFGGTTRSAISTYNATGVRTFSNTILWNSYLEIPSSFTRTYNDPSFSILPNISTDNIESPIYTYSSDNPFIANIVNGTITLGNLGSANITINQSATTNYTSVTANTIIYVNKYTSDLTFPSSFTRNYNDPSFSILFNISTNNPEGPTYSYSSDYPLIANIVDGIVIIGNAGIANIIIAQSETAYYAGVTANTTITVNKLQANLGYPFSIYTKNYKDPSFNLNANTSNPESSQILYSSDNTNVANVDINGNVILGNMGTANITLFGNATTNYNYVSANISITVNNIPATLGYPFSSYTKNYLDPSFNLNANTTNTDNTTILYSTDNSSVVTVNTTGNVTIGNAGTANITLFGNATMNYNSVSANILITVNKIQANLGYPFSNYTKNYKDASFNVNANTTNTDSTQIVYSTDNAIVATVNALGNVTIGNAGTANITLFGNATTNYNSINANILITVNKLQANLGYPFSSYTKNYLDASFPLDANTNNTDNTQIVYSTDNTNVAMVDSATGNVTIGNAGIANILLFGDATTNYNSVSANILITVNPIDAVLDYPFSSYTQNYLDESFPLDATTTNTDSTEIVYSTDDSSVATVNASGNVIIGNAGTANILLFGNATANYNSVSANILITVNPIEATLDYPFSSYTKNYLDESFPLDATTTNTDSTEIVYSIDNSNVATVNASGNVTIGNAGTANITLFGNTTLNYNSVSANILITVNPIQATLGYPLSSYIKNYLDPSFSLNANTTNTDSTQILYSSDNTNVANVDINGNVTIGNAGTTNILLFGDATTNYNSVNAVIVITVNPIQANLGYPYSSYIKNYLDPSFPLNANTTNTDSTQILYSTNNTSVATVNANGNVTIGNAGTANITLFGNATTNYNSINANILITVNKIQANLNYPSYLSITKNYLDPSFPLNANTTNTDSPQILYSIDNINVANVDINGNVILGNMGMANITLIGNATTNYYPVIANIQLTINSIYASLQYPYSSYTKNYLDPSFSLNATTTNTDSPQILYTTDNTRVATVDINGNVMIGNVGTANITLFGNATLNYDSVTANILITVNPIQANLNYPAYSSYTKNYLDVAFPLNANTTNTDDTQILYSTDNTNVAIVNTIGLITIGNVGTANISLTGNKTINYNSVSANIQIIVNKILPNIQYTASYQKTYKDPSFNLNVNTNNTDNIPILYSTDNSIVANVNTTGNITIGNVGTANITLIRNASANYYPINANILINVAKLPSNIQANTAISKMYYDPSFNVDATTNNDETPIQYTSGNTYIATVFDQTGNIIIGNIGSTTITLYQPDTTNYSSNTTIISLYINKLQWNLGTIPLNNWESIAYGNGIFVAVSSIGNYSRILTSRDLINWSSPTYPYTSNSDNIWYIVKYLNNMFIVLGNSKALVSYDSIQWEVSNFYYTPSLNLGWTGIAYGNDIFIGITPAIAVDNLYILSFDGINWQTNQNSPGGYWRDIAYGNGVFVAVGYNSGVISTSSNGFNWTNQYFPNSWWSITYGNGLFVVFSTTDSGSIIITSPDGMNWT